MHVQQIEIQIICIIYVTKYNKLIISRDIIIFLTFKVEMNI